MDESMMIGRNDGGIRITSAAYSDGMTLGNGACSLPKILPWKVLEMPSSEQGLRPRLARGQTLRNVRISKRIGLGSGAKRRKQVGLELW